MNSSVINRFISNDLARSVLFLRHGCTDWNVAGKFQGSSDIALNSLGVEQAFFAAKMVASLDPWKIVSSDLVRAYETAKPLGKLTSLQIECDVRLRETNGGVWEGLNSKQIKQNFPEEFSLWISGNVQQRAGGGESRLEVADRMVAAVNEYLLQIPAGKLLVVVTHGGAIRSVLNRMLNLPYENWDVLGGLTNCSWSVLQEQHDFYGFEKGEYVSRNVSWKLIEHNAGSLPEFDDSYAG